MISTNKRGELGCHSRLNGVVLSIHGPRSYRNISNEGRDQIINAHQSGSSLKITSTYENLQESTVWNIIQNYLKTGRINKDHGGRRQNEVNDNILNFIREKEDEDCSLTLNQISHLILENLNVTLAASTIHNCFDKMLYSLKNILYLPIRRNYEHTIRIRNGFA
ncbi:hypothetical protein RF11_04795 [Thelohanellus kitauei]|uniref:Tc1-like transposase DDE domain-containing protein n=1 Tax=Thelohanellus kitauei TaxID=669202 RepID=A0A0C2NFN7_THEKT|nr:hypothetical protein RF11_04795 [Thelohanellus kitauei]